MSKPENTDDRVPSDLANVNINEEWELRWWARELGMSEDNLRAAVTEVGTATTKLREYRPPH
ncbi:DUF3606 domain-containing protein [Xanthomonas sp. AmX2]|uniref:DUF3606 domain-containing protein n=1 Tax=Xanthomonas sp. TaxID=29446 RepID=UPI00197E4150|nr:DUF3606 domain-containing protein [Xanthomonas sp.]MBN6150842.1 DUF3606 domain-containing protein [Xanthomonas sp.]